MNKGFRFYFSKALTLSFYSYKKVPFATKILLGLYFVISTVFKLFFFLRPVFAIVDNNIANMIKDAHKISFEKIFHGVTKKKYVDLLVTYLIQDALLIAVFAVIVFGPMMINITRPSIVGFIFAIFAGIIAAVIAFFIVIKNEMYGFIAQRSIDLDCSDYLFSARESIKKNRGTVLLCYLVPTLIVAALISVCVIPMVFVSSNIKLNGNVRAAICIGIFIVLVLIYYFLVVPFSIEYATIHYLLYSDICNTKKSIAVKPTAGRMVGYTPIFNDQESEVEKLDLMEKKEGK